MAAAEAADSGTATSTSATEVSAPPEANAPPAVASAVAAESEKAAASGGVCKATAAAEKAKGNDAFQAKRYAEAIEHFTAAIRADPSDHVFFSNRSACYASMEQYEKALEDGRECVRLKPEWPKGYTRKAHAEYFLKRYDDAADTYKAGLKLAPADAALKEGLQKAMDAKYEVRDASQVAPELARIAERNPKIKEYLKDKALVQKVNMLMAAGKNMQMGGPQEALMMQMIQQDKRVLEVFMATQGIDIGDASVLSTPKAAPKAAAKAQPATSPTSVPQAAQDGKEEAPKAKEVGKDATPTKAADSAPSQDRKEATPTPSTNLKRKAEEFKNEGNQLYKKRKFAEALSCYDKAIEEEPNELTYVNNKCAVWIEMGEEHYPKVLSACEDVLKRRYDINSANPGGASFEKVAKVYNRMASVLERQKRYGEAIEMYNKSLTEDNSRSTRNALREVERVKEKFEKEQYFDPTKAEEHREKGNEHFKTNSFAEAKAEYDEAIRRNPKDARLYSNRAAALTKLLAYPDALRDLEECLSLDPKFVKAYSRKGTAHFFMKEYHKALEAYDKGLALEPGNDECLRGRDQVLAKVNETQKGDVDEEQVRHAMADPEIQKMLHDPQIKNFLNSLEESPAQAQKAMREDPRLKNVVQKLMAAGIIRTR